MNSDKMIFGSIAAVTILIFGFIIYTSFKTTAATTENLNPQNLIGSAPHMKGQQNAKVTLVEFADFQCPSCNAAAPVVDALVAKYPNDLALVYRHFPLPMHSNSVTAAKASEAADMQGKFWEYHDELFGHFEKYSYDEYVSYAQNIGLNVDKFKSDYASEESANRVNEDSDLAAKLGLNGTPTFFLIHDGKAEELTLNSLDDIENAVKKALDTAPAK